MTVNVNVLLAKLISLGKAYQIIGNSLIVQYKTYYLYGRISKTMVTITKVRQDGLSDRAISLAIKGGY